MTSPTLLASGHPGSYIGLKTFRNQSSLRRLTSSRSITNTTNRSRGRASGAAEVTIRCQLIGGLADGVCTVGADSRRMFGGRHVRGRMGQTQVLHHRPVQRPPVMDDCLPPLRYPLHAPGGTILRADRPPRPEPRRVHGRVPVDVRLRLLQGGAALRVHQQPQHLQAGAEHPPRRLLLEQGQPTLLAAAGVPVRPQENALRGGLPVGLPCQLHIPPPPHRVPGQVPETGGPLRGRLGDAHRRGYGQEVAHRVQGPPDEL